MMPELSSSLLLAPLALYILHALYRLIASESLPAVLAFIFGYFTVALVCRLTLPTLAMLPVWLPFLYPYAWTGTGAVLLACCCLKVGRNGVQLEGIPPMMQAFALSQLCLHLGLIMLTSALGGRPMQAYAMLPPLVAASGYGLYRLCLWHTRRQHGWLSWSGILACTLLAPLAMGWMAEWLVPVLLRHF